MAIRAIISLALLSVAPVQCQFAMKSSEPGVAVRLLPPDAAMLESGEPRADLACTLKPIKPELGFDLDFHSGYEVAVPLRQLAGPRNRLTVIFQVTPEDRQEEPVSFLQHWSVPAIREEAKGVAEFQGSFVVGEGKYQVHWLMRDQAERYCTAQWQISVARHRRDPHSPLGLASAPVSAETDLFAAEPPVKREAENSLHILVLLNVAPQAPGGVVLGPAETALLLSILRRIAREPRIGIYSIAAFNVEQSEVLYRRNDSSQIDFPALGEALRQAHLGTVRFDSLRRKDSKTQFLRRLLDDAVAENRPDGLIFVGPKVMGSTPINGHLLKEFEAPSFSVFYLNYGSDPVANPWPDLIGSVVKAWRGFEYTITKPRDMLVSWTDLISRVSSKGPRSGVADRLPSMNLVPKKIDRTPLREYQ